MVDQQIAKEALRHFTKQGLDIRLGAKVITAKSGAKSVDVEYEVNGAKKKESFDKLIVAVGRRARTSVVKGKSVSVRVDLGGRRLIKKKTASCNLLQNRLINEHMPTTK